ncbi:hypothetical protein [Nitriliruptor alkaliphilus]|uniref:hypothetical protein n=1 Tax=Nitriliruptor alkaliphilus TaxID=427918 RepID=UPI0014706EB9|nr:hypothetical protein [Nitriliruptor alkaliphilus]
MRRIIGAGSLVAAFAFGAGYQSIVGQRGGDAILQASACRSLDWAGQAARFYADGGIEEEEEGWVSTWIRQLRMQEISDEVLESRHGQPLRDYLDVVTRSLETQNIVAGDAAAAAPAWDDLVARGAEVYDDFGCGARLPRPPGWSVDCDELVDEGRKRETCLTPDERRELREEHERTIAEISEQLREQRSDH